MLTIETTMKKIQRLCNINFRNVATNLQSMISVNIFGNLAIFEGSFNIWQNYKTYFGNFLCSWANVHGCT